MKLSTAKYLQIALTCIIILAALLACVSVYDTVVLVSGLVAIVAGVIDLTIWGRFWRCPHCGEHLGRFGSLSSGEYCPHCGEKLDID